MRTVTAPDPRLAAATAEIDTLRAQLAAASRQASWAIAEIPLPSVRHLVTLVCAEWGIQPAHILADRRAAWIVEPRQVVMWLAHEHLRHSLPRIGRCLLRDHTTVLHGTRVVAARMARDPEFAARVRRVAAQITIPSEAPNT
jgi:chromosomal replication initiation ATPase DnaA